MVRLLLAVFVLCCLAGPASAGALTCGMFKTRLAEALRGAVASEPVPNFTLAHDGGSLGRRSAWRDGHGLSARLTCGPGDAFADFYIAIEPSARPSAAVPEDVTGFKALGAAAICALSSGTPQACRDIMGSMTTDGVTDYTDDIADHDPQPKGLEDYDLADDVESVLYVTAKTFSFAVGPGVFATVDAERGALDPSERDTDDGADNED